MMLYKLVVLGDGGVGKVSIKEKILFIIHGIVPTPYKKNYRLL
jgi:GTPase SAR1 family protein